MNPEITNNDHIFGFADLILKEMFLKRYSSKHVESSQFADFSYNMEKTVRHLADQLLIEIFLKPCYRVPTPITSNYLQ